MLNVSWKRWLPRKFARFVPFRRIKKRSFNLLSVLDQTCIHINTPTPKTEPHQMLHWPPQYRTDSQPWPGRSKMTPGTGQKYDAFVCLDVPYRSCLMHVSLEQNKNTAVAHSRAKCLWRLEKDIPALARTAHNGLPLKRLEEDLCWIVPHVPHDDPVGQGTELEWTEERM